MRASIDISAKKLKEGILNILFPKECVGCRSEGSYLCQACLGTIFINEKFLCPNCEELTFFGATCSRCLKRGLSLDSLIFVTSYRDKLVREAISVFKYKGCQEVINDLKILLQKFFIKYHNVFPRADLIIPVPLHPWRQEVRDFNQSELIAQEVYEAKFRCTPQGSASWRRLEEGSLASTILHRVTNNPPQANLNSKERSQNVADIFKIENQKIVVGKSILLVDDVYTTGATMQECARILKSAGARKVHGFVLARG